MRYLVGLDDTDSAKGMCTTYLAYRIAVDLASVLRVLPYPRLVRLNPNVPFKTRGNAAICLEVETEDPSLAFERIRDKVSELSDVSNGANAGMVFAKSRESGQLSELYSRALTGMVNIHHVRNLLRERGIEHFELGNGMGLVGASASLGYDPLADHTFELISYRTRSRWGTKRYLDEASVRSMDAATFPRTFNNYDYQKGKVLVSPAGPDPVFAGVRGDSATTVIRAFKTLKTTEELAGYMVYVTNQYTDAHLHRRLDGKSYSCGWAEGAISTVITGRGGHTYLAVDTTSGPLDAAVYAPTGDLQRVSRLLVPGDLVRLAGGLRRPSRDHSLVLNVEKIEVLRLSPRPVLNPTCRACGSRMKSEGSGKGFQCRKCGSKLPSSARRKGHSSRSIMPGTYAPSPRAFRHLAKPLTRLGNESAGEPARVVEGWIASAPTLAPTLSKGRR